jgi:hypothetical protein
MPPAARIRCVSSAVESTGSTDGASVPTRRTPASASRRARPGAMGHDGRRERRLVHRRPRPQDPFRAAGQCPRRPPRHLGATRDVHDRAPPQIRVQRHRPRSSAVVRHVQHAVGVRAGMDAGEQRGHVHGVAALAPQGPRHGHRLVARPHGRAAAEGLGDVVNAHQAGIIAGRHGGAGQGAGCTAVRRAPGTGATGRHGVRRPRRCSLEDQSTDAEVPCAHHQGRSHIARSGGDCPRRGRPPGGWTRGVPDGDRLRPGRQRPGSGGRPADLRGEGTAVVQPHHRSSPRRCRRPRVVSDWPELADRAAAAFWPGPLTLVLPKRPEVPDSVTAGLDTVAVRVPAHPVALALLIAAGVPVAAPEREPLHARLADHGRARRPGPRRRRGPHPGRRRHALRHRVHGRRPDHGPGHVLRAPASSATSWSPSWARVEAPGRARRGTGRRCAAASPGHDRPALLARRRAGGLRRCRRRPEAAARPGRDPAGGSAPWSSAGRRPTPTR